MKRIKKVWYQLLARIYVLRGDTYRHFGNSYADVGEYWSAIEDYTRAITFDPAYVPPYYNRGVLYWREIGNAYRAIQDLTRVIELDPTWSEAYFNRAMAYRLHRDLDKAVADLETYLTVGRDTFWLEAAHRQLAELRSETGGAA